MPERERERMNKKIPEKKNTTMSKLLNALSSNEVGSSFFVKYSMQNLLLPFLDSLHIDDSLMEYSA